MKINTENDYASAIIKKFDDDYKEGRAEYLSDSSIVGVKNAITRLYKENRCSQQDEIIVRSFLGIGKNEDVLKRIEWYPNGKLKSTSEFLTKRPVRIPRRKGVTDLVAWLIDFQPRPYSKYQSQYISKEENGTPIEEKKPTLVDNNPTEQSKFKSNKQEIQKPKPKLFFKVSTAIIIVILLLLLAIAFGIGKSTHLISKDINALRQISIKEIPSYLETNATLWKGVSLKGETEYYNTSGEHPETGIKLRLVTNDELEKIIKEPNLPKPIIEEAIKKGEEKVVKSKAKGNRMAVFVFGKDLELGNKVKFQLQNKIFQNYTILGNLSSSTSVNQSVLEVNLKSGNIAILGKSLDKKIDYVCVGNFEHSFRSSTINSEMIICDLDVNYTVYATNGVVQPNLSKSDTYTGQGFTESEALKNAIKQIE